jgi:hypothetical protein
MKTGTQKDVEGDFRGIFYGTIVQVVSWKYEENQKSVMLAKFKLGTFCRIWDFHNSDCEDGCPLDFGAM